MKNIVGYLEIVIVLACVAILVALALPASAADTSACYSISDPDQRTYCIARARREPSACYAVQRADLRAECLAETRK